MTAPAVAEPPVLAKGNELACGEKHDSEHIRCGRPFGHKGGHLSSDRSKYWQQEEEPKP